MSTCLFYHKMLYYLHSGDIAHLVERLVRNQQVVGSSPIISKKRCSLTKESFFIFKALSVRKFRTRSVGSADQREEKAARTPPSATGAACREATGGCRPKGESDYLHKINALLPKRVFLFLKH